MPLPPDTIDDATVDRTVPPGTILPLTLEQFAESFEGFIFMIDFQHPGGGVTRQPCRVLGEVDEEGFKVMVVER